MLKSWRFWVLVVLLVGPFATYIGLGFLWLLERGWLLATIASGTWIGSGVVRGVPVVGYALTIDAAKAAALPGAYRADVEAMLKAYGAEQFPVVVWVDGQNLVRRETLTVTIPPINLPTAVTGTMSP